MDPLSFDIPFQGKQARVVLALLPWSTIARIAILPERKSPASLTNWLESNVFWSAATIDGETRTRARRLALAADPIATAAILAKRYDIYQQLRAAGRIYAQCPHCREGEVEMSLLGLFNTLGVMPPEMISADFAYFRSPVSNDSQPPPLRPKQLAYASRVRFVLPTTLLGLPRASFEAGVLGRASYWRAQPAWERWETDGVNVPNEKGWHHRENDAFCTTIWLIAATREVTPPGEVTLEAFEQLPGVDVYFLDAIYRLAFDTDVPEHALPRTCPHCHGSFVPVAELVHEYG